MPSNHKPAKAQGRSRAAAAVVVVVVAVVIGFLAISNSPVHQRPTLCTAGSGSGALELTVGQAGIASTIAGVASSRSMPPRAVAIAYAAALQESKLTDPDYGDRDSVGVFQQRPSEGWGTPKQIENPVYASSRFFAALAAVPRYEHLPIYAAAQAVQLSADGSAYGQYATMGKQLADAFTGTKPHDVWCSYGSPGHRVKLAAASEALNSAFGKLHQSKAGDPATTVRVGSAQQGWAVAAWLLSHASTYGVTNVRFGGFAWQANKGTGHWVKLPASARTPADANAVVFG